MSKGRPTPKRREAQKVRRSLAPAATKEAKREQKEASRRLRAQQREAYLRGDESALPIRDRGPVKRLARDVIDSRRNIAEYLMPLVFVVLALSIIQIQMVQVVATILLYLVMIAAIVDCVVLSRRVRKLVEERFPNEQTKGLTSYTILRATQIRRLRIPRPRVQRGTSVK